MEQSEVAWNTIRDCVTAVCCTVMFVAFIYLGTRDGDRR